MFSKHFTFRFIRKLLTVFTYLYKHLFLLKKIFYRDFNVQLPFSSLKYLVLDNNMISSINNFPNIPSLESLSISNNSINDVTNFILSIKTKFPRLKSVNTFRNAMNPGVNQPAQYNQYKNYLKQISTLTEIDGMNINDNSFMQQTQQKQNLFDFSNNTQQQPKRDLFGTSTNTATTKVNFFDMPSTNTNTNLTKSVVTQNNNMNNVVQNKPKMSMFDMPTQNIVQNNNVSNVVQNNVVQSNKGSSMMQMMGVSKGDSAVNNQKGLVFKRQFFVIDESAEIDGSEFVNSKKKKSLIMVNEKILKKSDNMTKFNRKNKSEGNKHILNADL